MTTKVLFLTVILFSQVLIAGQDGGNGGSGISINGKIMTLGSAGVKYKINDLDEVPGMNKFISSILDLKLSSSLKLSILENVTPTDIRKYYKLKSIDPADHKRILKEYSNILDVDSTDLRLFAVTDYEYNTILLPDFFHLTEIEQATILFHESLWLKARWLSYQQVVKSEIIYQKYLENPQDQKARFDFLNVLYKISGNPKYFLDFFSTFNVENVTPTMLLGSDFSACVTSGHAFAKNCTDELVAYLKLLQITKGATYFQLSLLLMLESHKVNLTALDSRMNSRTSPQVEKIVFNEDTFFITTRSHTYKLRFSYSHSR